MTRAASLLRFAAVELALWACLYGAYLAIRDVVTAEPERAFAHASSVIGVERAVGVFHEAHLQDALAWAHGFFSAYYTLGFAPLLAGTLVWLALRRRAYYCELRTLLLVSLGIAVVFYVLYPTAPPRLVPGLGISDTVGLAGHDTGSFAGVRFNPYAAMPSMHVGWSLLVGLVGFRAAQRLPLRAFFALHPLLMTVAVTATGNHYFLDSLVGSAVALAAVALVAALRRLRLRWPPAAEVIHFYPRPEAPQEHARRAA